MAKKNKKYSVSLGNDSHVFGKALEEHRISRHQSRTELTDAFSAIHGKKVRAHTVNKWFGQVYPTRPQLLLTVKYFGKEFLIDADPELAEVLNLRGTQDELNYLKEQLETLRVEHQKLEIKLATTKEILFKIGGENSRR